MLTFCRRDAAAPVGTDAHAQARKGMMLSVVLEVNRLSSSDSEVKNFEHEHHTK
jgi:hypothetical protein